MHRFNRGDSPVDFRKISRKYINWDDFFDKSRDEHRKIRDALYKRQHYFCAYCERRIKVCKGKNTDVDSPDGHIEHLERRADIPEKTFNWDNLFYSCENKDSCGHFKDGLKGDDRRFNVAEIIDPSKENPLDYFNYDANNGEFGFFPDATLKIKQKVIETVRIFNLNGSEKLKTIRREVCRKASYLLDGNYTDEEIDNYLKDLPDNTPCISVYYVLLDRRSEYEERFTSKSTIQESDA